MKKAVRNIVLVAGASALLVLTMACSSAQPTATPGVDQMGQFIMMQKGPELEAVIGYRFAAQNLGSDWLILETALTSPFSDMTEVKRANIWVISPDGTKINLASQKEFNEAYSILRPLIHKSDVARDPMNYFPPSRKECDLGFFVEPGDGVAFDSVTVNYKRGCTGKLFFRIPGGVKAGQWKFGIDLPNSKIEIPFEL